MASLKNLLQMSQSTPTQFWNDSCATGELRYAIDNGAAGATTNPVIVGQVLKNETERYLPVIKSFIHDYRTASEDDVAWMLNEYMAAEGAAMLLPVFNGSGGKSGFISIQTNAKYYRNPANMLKQALHFKELAKNIMVKIPATEAGIAAVEESVFNGVNINATVSFTVAQAVCVAEAVERAFKRREHAGLPNDGLCPVCTIMVGRIEDWLRETAKEENILTDPEIFDLSGVAVFKHAYEIYKKKNYRTRLLAAAFRSHLHCSEFVGGDVSMTIPGRWIKMLNETDFFGGEMKNRMDIPVDGKIISQLKKYFKDFSRAYEPDGMKPKEFAHFGASRATLTQFLNGYDEMVGIIRKVLV
ncbi:MAG: transaldolase family protein [Defluviitaleaceae bacterium]|nr:transaldolase family protein [Defluviitaleaceae bacterium]